MKINIKPGRYIAAISGGVDSMALLHMLAQLAHEPALGIDLVVAHYDHGIRPDSALDRQLVAAEAARYGLLFIYDEGFLGAHASEAQARKARYAFLRRAAVEHVAQAIITAHHQDDVLETAIINMVRGTGSRGLSSLRSAGDVVRPLLGVTKEQLRSYAQAHNITWREDSTNADDRYLRNYVRRQLVPTLQPAHRVALLSATQLAARLNDEIEAILLPYITENHLERRWFVQLPHQVAAETMAAWLRRRAISFDRKTIERLVVFSKTAQPGKRASVDGNHYLTVSKEHIIIRTSF